MLTILSFNRNYCIFIIYRKLNLVSRYLELQNWITIVHATRRSYKVSAKSRRKSFQLISSLGSSVCICTYSIKIVTVGNRTTRFIANNRLSISATYSSSWIAILNLCITTIQICNNSTCSPSTCGTISSVITAIYTYLSVYVTNNSCRIIAVWCNVSFIYAV